jgi:hypothetical protein
MFLVSGFWFPLPGGFPSAQKHPVHLRLSGFPVASTVTKLGVRLSLGLALRLVSTHENKA